MGTLSFHRHLIRFLASIIKGGKSDYPAHKHSVSCFDLKCTFVRVGEGQAGLKGLLGSRLPGAAPCCPCWHSHHAWVARAKTRPRTWVTCGLPRMCTSSERARCQRQAHGASLPCYSSLTGRNFNEVVGLQYKNGAARQTVKLRDRRWDRSVVMSSSLIKTYGRITLHHAFFSDFISSIGFKKTDFWKFPPNALEWVATFEPCRYLQQIQRCLRERSVFSNIF